MESKGEGTHSKTTNMVGLWLLNIYALQERKNTKEKWKLIYWVSTINDNELRNYCTDHVESA